MIINHIMAPEYEEITYLIPTPCKLLLITD